MEQFEEMGLEEKKYIVFQLYNEEFAVPVSQVRGIEKLHKITRVPGAAPEVKGVINLRGIITPVIDLKICLDLPLTDPTDFTDSTRVIIVTINNSDVGLLVDEANDVLDIDLENIEPSPEVVGGKEVEYVDGVYSIDKRLLLLLNLDKVLDVG